MPQQDEQAIRAAYDSVADLYADTFWSTGPEQAIDLAMIDHFARLVQPPRRVLDAGCGAGRMMPQLAACGCLVEGFDLSPAMVRRAREDHPGYLVNVGTLTNLDCEDGAFEGIFAWYSTIHTSEADLSRVFGEMRRALVPGGHALIAFQSGTGTRDVGRLYREHGRDIDLHRHARDVTAVTDTLLGAGLTAVCRMERAPVGDERDSQAVIIAQARSKPPFPRLVE